MDLFTSVTQQNNLNQPLADRMRPTSLDEFIGQAHLLSKGKLLRKLIETDNVQSMILYGPPASGKTSLAYIISIMTCANFVMLNAVSLSIAELRSVMQQAKDTLNFYNKKTIVFIDEIHAMKSNIQMALLQAVETGSITLIGATTESIAHEMIPPLISRCKVYQFNPLSSQDIKLILERALTNPTKGLGQRELTIEDQALNYLADICNNDVRSALNALEVAAYSIPQGSIDLDIIQQAFQFRVTGTSTTESYDMISAFIKSIRGSASQAAIYWLARLLASGTDPAFIARRLIIQAAEDVGLANPQALSIAIAAKQAVEFIGMPEARIPLAEATIYLAESPKSNSAYKAINAALAYVENNQPYQVPNQLKNSTGLYKNPIDHPTTNINYLPISMENQTFYKPQNSGIEKNIFIKHKEKN